jgi:hypothetical protein
LRDWLDAIETDDILPTAGHSRFLGHCVRAVIRKHLQDLAASDLGIEKPTGKEFGDKKVRRRRKKTLPGSLRMNPPARRGRSQGIAHWKRLGAAVGPKKAVQMHFKPRGLRGSLELQ